MIEMGMQAQFFLPLKGLSHKNDIGVAIIHICWERLKIKTVMVSCDEFKKIYIS